MAKEDPYNKSNPYLGRGKYQGTQAAKILGTVGQSQEKYGGQFGSGLGVQLRTQQPLPIQKQQDSSTMPISASGLTFSYDPLWTPKPQLPKPLKTENTCLPPSVANTYSQKLVKYDNSKPWRKGDEWGA